VGEVVVDKHEKGDAGEKLKQLADRVEHLGCDVRIHTNGGFTLEGERKLVGSDAKSSWFKGDLRRQLSNVDFFLVEMPPTNLMTRSDLDEFFKHLGTLAFHIPVIPSTSARQTMEHYRHLASKQNLEMREVSITYDAPTTRERIVEALPGIGPKKRQDVKELINWQAVKDALEASEWEDLKGVGPATTQDVKDALNDAKEK
jgi:hypothetical protein